MALNLKNPEVERLAEDVARLTGETKTEAVRRSLAERHQRLLYRHNTIKQESRVRDFLEQEVWPQVPKSERGKRMPKAEEEELLGYDTLGA